MWLGFKKKLQNKKNIFISYKIFLKMLPAPAPSPHSPHPQENKKIFYIT
jgi:hypothetical protein